MSRAQTPLFFPTRLVFNEPYLHVPFGCGLVLKCRGRCPVRFCLPSAFRCRDSGTRLVQGKEASPLLQQHKGSYSEHGFGLTTARMLWESESVPGGDYPPCCGSGALARPAPHPGALRSHQQRTRVVQQHWGRRGALLSSLHPLPLPLSVSRERCLCRGAAGAQGAPRAGAASGELSWRRVLLPARAGWKSA